MARILLLLCTILYVAACFVPALLFHKFILDPSAYDVTHWTGAQVLGMGWMGALVGQFAWYANPFWLLGWLCLLFRRPIWARIWFIITLLIAFHTFMLFGQILPADEAGVNRMMLIDLLIGAYLWFASIGIGLIGAFFTTRRRRFKTA